MQFRTLIALLLLASASPEIRYFQYQRAVENAPQPHGKTCVVLDAALFAHAAPRLADLRLYRQGTETPFAIRTATRVEPAQKSITPLNLGESAGAVSFDAEMSTGTYSDVELDVDAHDFIATVVVAGSERNREAPSMNLGKYTIFDLTRQKLGRSTILHLPPSNFAILHFRIVGAIRPENVKGLSVERMPAIQPLYQLVATSSSFRQEAHRSIAELTVPAHVPVDRLSFTVDPEPASFSRPVNISIAPVARTSQEVEPSPPVTASGNLLRIHGVQEGHRIDEEHLTVEAPDVNLASPTRWTISIDNGDDAPLHVNAVRLEMLQRSLCFESAGAGQYTLFYGDPALAAPRYDYAALFAYQPAGAAATASPEQPNPAYQARPDQRPFSERHPALLWIALAAVIALLGQANQSASLSNRARHSRLAGR